MGQINSALYFWFDEKRNKIISMEMWNQFLWSTPNKLQEYITGFCFTLPLKKVWSIFSFWPLHIHAYITYTTNIRDANQTNKFAIISQLLFHFKNFQFFYLIEMFIYPCNIILFQLIYYITHLLRRIRAFYFSCIFYLQYFKSKSTLNL